MPTTGESILGSHVTDLLSQSEPVVLTIGNKGTGAKLQIYDQNNPDGGYVMSTEDLGFTNVLSFSRASPARYMITTYGDEQNTEINHLYMSTKTSQFILSLDDDVFQISPSPDGGSFSISANGNVGINNTNPTYKLDVNGRGNFTDVLTAPTAAAGTNTTQVATTAFVANAVSNTSTVGLAPLASPAFTGSMSLTSSAPGAISPTLTVTNTAGGANSAVAIDFNTYTHAQSANPGVRILAIDDGAASAHLIFSTKIPGNVANLLSERMRIASNGNVGIGNNNPQFKLDVNGTGNFSGILTASKVAISGSYPALRILGNEEIVTIDFVTYQSSYAQVNVSIPPATLSVRDDGIWSAHIIFSTRTPGFYTNSLVERMRIASNGNVGIGNNNPQFKLDVTGTGNFSGILTAPTAAAGTNTTQVATTAFVANAVSNTSTVGLAPLASPAFTGNVGIGIANPQARLHVNGGVMTRTSTFPAFISADTTLGTDSPGDLYAGDPGQGQLMITGSTNTNKRLALMYDTTNNIGLIQCVIVGTSPSPLCLNAAAGNVGIGNTNPQFKLDVTGTGNFSGVLTAPTAPAGTQTTQVATTAFVKNGYAPIASPTFTGSSIVLGNGTTTTTIGNRTGGTALILSDITTAQWKMDTAGYVLSFINDDSNGTFNRIRFRLYNTGQVYTANNTLDDGSGGASFAGVVTANTLNVTGVVTANTLNVTGNLVTTNVSAGNLGIFRNRIINGDMSINQRVGASGNAGTTGNTCVANAYVGVDRWVTGFVIRTGVIQQLQVTLISSDTPFTYGFKYSLRFTVTQACTNYDYFVPQHMIEAYNISDWNWNGNSQGSSVTFSFWFRAAATGSYNYVLRNGQSWVGTFNYTTANAWVYYTFTIPAPTGSSTAFNVNNNGTGIQFQIASVVKTNTTNILNAWNNNRSECPTSGYVDWPATLNNYIEFTGVQLEKGTIATPFEFRPFAIELQLCQRYFEKSYRYSDAPGKNTGQSGDIDIIQWSIITANRPSYNIRYLVPKRIVVIPTIYSSIGTVNKVSNYTADRDYTLENRGLNGFSLYANGGGIGENIYMNYTVNAELIP